MKNKTADLFDEHLRVEIEQEIAVHEGVVFAIYQDHLGHKTVGIGHLITRDDKEYDLPVGYEVSEDRVIELFEQDMEEAFMAANRLVPSLYAYPKNVQRVLVNMAFNLGYYRLKSFKKMLKAVKEQDYTSAATEMLDSLWAKQVPKRARELTELMESASERITRI